MSDDNNGLDAQKQQSGDGGDAIDLTTLPEAVQTYIRSLRGEAAEKRKRLQALEAQMNEMQQKQLAEQGKWKELAEAREAELNKVKPYQTRAEALEARITANNKARVERIPEHFRSLIPQLPPEDLAAWLDANETKLTTPPAPNLDAGAGGGEGKTAIQLTAEQLAVAKGMGISPEDYAKFIKK
jgi:phage I-like protein